MPDQKCRVALPFCIRRPDRRLYRTALNRKDRHKITFDLFSDEARSYVQKCVGYADGDIADDLHRGHCYRVRFNSEPRHPQIEEILEELAC